MTAVGRQPAATPWFEGNVLDLGAPGPYQLKGYFDAPNQAPTIRAAMDWVVANHPNETVVLRFPRGSFHCYGLIRAAADEKIAWQGHPAGTELFRDFPNGEPVVWHGFGREVLDGPTYWRDTTSGIYDGSVTPGTRWGLALPQKACAGWFTGNGWEWWDGTSYDSLCVSLFFQVEQYATYSPTVMNLVSLGDTQWEDGVFVLQITPVNAQVNIFINSADGGARYDVNGVNPADWGGLHRIDFQWDRTGTLSAWWDSQPVTATPAANWSASPRAATGVLRRNNRFPLLLNSGGPYLRLEDPGMAANYSRAPLAVYGLHVSRAPRFSAGQPIAATDSARYFTRDASTAGLLPLTDPPPAAGVKVPPFWRSWTGAGESTWGVVCPPPVQGGAGWYSPTFEVSRGSTAGITFRAYRTAYMAGQTASDVSFTGCGFVSTVGSGFGQYEVGSAYMLRFNGCVFSSSGRDELQVADSLCIVTDAVFNGSNPTCNVRTISSEVELRSPKAYNAASGPYAIELWKGRYTAPITRIRNCMIDNEVLQSPARAIVVSDTGGRLVIEDSDLGGAAAGAVTVDLLGTTQIGVSPPSLLPSTFHASRCHNRASGGFVRVAGPDWSGQIEALDAVNGTEAGDALIDGTADGDCGGVVFRDLTAMAPRAGRWLRGRAAVEWPAAGPGMVSLWTCCRSGHDHAADPADRPLWAGAAVMPAAAGEMAAYGWGGFSGGWGII